MNKKRSYIIAALLFFGGMGYWVYLGFKSKSVYEEVRRDDVKQYGLEVRPVEPSDLSQLERVRAEWISTDVREPRPKELGKVMEELFYPVSVDGVVRLWSEEMPPYSWTNNQQNEVWAKRSVFRMVFSPASNADAILHDEGIMIMATDHRLEVYEDTADGLMYSFYYNPKPVAE